MADFRPNTSVEFYSATGVSGENQPYFTSESAKLGWYRAHDPLTVGTENYSYQRENSNAIRVQGKAENFRKFDMMAFKNDSGKWVFCQIEEVEFINPNTVEVRYSVDYFQTYIENITFGRCWVEREMQSGDWNGSTPSFNNLQPEGLETGQMLRESLLDVKAGGNVIHVLSSLDQNGEPNVEASTTNGVTIPINDITLTTSGLSTMLSKYTELGKEDAIAGIYLVPSFSGSPNPSASLSYSDIDGYTPVNSKCFSSEFYTIKLGNKEGEENTLRPEYLTIPNTVRLEIISRFLGGTGGALCYPTNYKTNEPKGEGVYLAFQVQVPWSSAAYYNWLRVEGPGFGIRAIGDLLNGAIKGFSSENKPNEVSIWNPTDVITSGISSASTAISKIVDGRTMPSYTSGAASGSTFPLTSDGYYGFYLAIEAPARENIESIDNYFSKYGYRTNRYKVPNYNTRPKWNYIKTAGACISGPFPKSAQKAITAQMDAGVTLWHLSPGENITDNWNPVENKE